MKPKTLSVKYHMMLQMTVSVLTMNYSIGNVIRLLRIALFFTIML